MASIVKQQKPMTYEPSLSYFFNAIFSLKRALDPSKNNSVSKNSNRKNSQNLIFKNTHNHFDVIKTIYKPYQPTYLKFNIKPIISC